MMTDRRPTILIADDSASHLRLMEFMLASEHHDVVAVENGRDVLAYLRERTPDLIVLDIEMPFLSGLDLCGRIKAVPRLRDVPVILVTSLRDDRTRASRPVVRADEMLEKPISRLELLEVVNRYLPVPVASTFAGLEPGATRPEGWRVAKY